MHQVVTILFNGFETLDVFGPVEILGRLKEEFNVNLYSMEGEIIKSSQGVPVHTRPLSQLNLENYILMIPGGIGTRELIDDEVFLEHLKTLSINAEYILTICTGSILLAKTGFWMVREQPLIKEYSHGLRIF
jgi:Putative intracellular protease/amidase